VQPTSTRTAPGVPGEAAKDPWTRTVIAAQVTRWSANDAAAVSRAASRAVTRESCRVAGRAVDLTAGSGDPAGRDDQ
jgi:hypothetical protein